MLIKVLSIAYYVLLLALIIVAAKPELKKKYYVGVKMLVSAGFLLLAYIIGIINKNYVELIHILPAFLGCFVGDYFMGKYNRLRQKKFLILGMLFFMLAHVGFVSYLYWMESSVLCVDILLPILIIPVTYLCAYLAHLHLGRVRPAAAIYSCFVTAFMVKAIHRGVVLGNLEGILLILGGVLFFASDTSLLFLYFYHFREKKNERIIHIFNLLSYYVAMYFIAMTVFV